MVLVLLLRLCCARQHSWSLGACLPPSAEVGDVDGWGQPQQLSAPFFISSATGSDSAPPRLAHASRDSERTPLAWRPNWAESAAAAAP
jgi:hypothetical protein